MEQLQKIYRPRIQHKGGCLKSGIGFRVQSPVYLTGTRDYRNRDLIAGLQYLMQLVSPAQNYLRKENQELRYQVQQLKQMLDYNKEALRKTIGADAAEIKQLLKLLYAENDNLRQRLNRNYDELSMMNSTMLIGEQIVLATESHEKRLIEELRSKIQSLKLELRERERRIAELEKSRLVIDKGSSMLVKTVFVTTSSLIQMKYHDQVERLNEELRKRDTEIEKQRLRNEDLFRLNLVLNKQLIDMKTSGVTTLTSGKKTSDYEEILECHQQLRKSDEESSYNSSEASDRGSEKEQEKCPRKAPVPKLQLGKAKEIQELIVKKIINKDAKKKKSQIAETINQQKAQLQKELQEQKLKSFNNERRISKLLRITTELEQRNKLLVDKKVNSSHIPHVMEDPSKEYLQELQIRNMLEVAKDVYLNDTLDKVIREEVELQYRDGAVSV